MPETEHVSFDVWVDPERTEPADFGLLFELGELPIVRLFAPTAAAARELRDYILQPDMRSAIANALFDALAELEAMDTLEDFERCR